MSNHRTVSLRPFTAALAAVAALGGCATVFKGKTTPISVTSNTPGATVTIDGRAAGVTPVTVEVANSEDAVIAVQQNGHEETCKLATNASLGWIVADVLFTAEVGLIIDWATHRWNNIGPSSCHVSL